MEKDNVTILQIDVPETEEMKKMGLGSTIHVIMHNPPQKKVIVESGQSCSQERKGLILAGMRLATLGSEAMQLISL